jgi:hypothetical protein
MYGTEPRGLLPDIPFSYYDGHTFLGPETGCTERRFSGFTSSVQGTARL